LIHPLLEAGSHISNISGMTHEHPPASRKAPYQSNFAVVHFSRTYDEAFTLLVEARNYLAAHRSKHRKRHNNREAIARCVEEMRMTTRLIRAMAWLLAVKAVEEGEILWEDVIDTDDLMVDLRICLEERDEACASLSPGLLDLMDRAQALYMRTARMELQVAARCAN
jgi:regulator of CtrA degradation